VIITVFLTSYKVSSIMRVEVITHKSGEQIPILLDQDGLPIPTPNEFILGRRSLGTNTLVRNLRELCILYRWLENVQVDIWERIYSGKFFSEAEIKGGMIESLRKEQANNHKVKKLSVKPLTFNQRLMTVRQFLSWCCDVHLSGLALDDLSYERKREQQERLLRWLDSSFINAPPDNVKQRKGLSEAEAQYLTNLLNPDNSNVFGRDSAVRARNYVLTILMLNYGLRPGEALSLRVEDVEFGAISAIRILRRPQDPNDKRRPRPQIKRNGRVMPIDDPHFIKILDRYILQEREVLEAKSDKETDYLILSDEGQPLSQSSVTQFFQILRYRYPDDLPSHLTAKALRHTFSSFMEKSLRALGMEEERRKQALAFLRGDSSLGSQAVYIAQEIEEQACTALKSLHRRLLGNDYERRTA
jgi:integrase